MLTISYLFVFLTFFSTGMNSIMSLDVSIRLSFEVDASVTYFKESRTPVLNGVDFGLSVVEFTK